jgi:hypothetical protein
MLELVESLQLATMLGRRNTLTLEPTPNRFSISAHSLSDFWALLDGEDFYVDRRIERSPVHP